MFGNAFAKMTDQIADSQIFHDATHSAEVAVLTSQVFLQMCVQSAGSTCQFFIIFFKP